MNTDPSVYDDHWPRVKPDDPSMTGCYLEAFRVGVGEQDIATDTFGRVGSIGLNGGCGRYSIEGTFIFVTENQLNATEDKTGGKFWPDENRSNNPTGCGNFETGPNTNVPDFLWPALLETAAAAGQGKGVSHSFNMKYICCQPKCGQIYDADSM